MEKKVYIPWSSAYSGGIPTIDEQHKQWITILNNFHDAVTLGQGQLFVLETLEKFFEYTQYHFSEEETLMQNYNYNELESHIKIHKEMIWEITHLRLEFGKNNIVLSIKTLGTLKDWLIKHILGLDMEFANYVKLVNEKNHSKSKKSLGVTISPDK